MLQSTHYKAWILDFFKKWVDDHTNFRFPRGGGETLPDGSSAPFHYTQSSGRLHALFRTFTCTLAFSWRPTKWHDFADVFTHLGLLWDLTNRTVDLPDEKRRKYLHKIADLLAVSKGYHRVSCKDAMSIDSTLSHVAFVIPHGHITCQTCPHSSRSTRRDMLYAARSLGHFGLRMVV
jgi:hypothetical protein